MKKAITPTTSMTRAACRKRRTTKASIAVLQSGTAARRSGRRPRYLELLLGDAVEHHLVVGTLLQLDVVPDAPGQRLLVQRDVADVIVRERVGLEDQLVALGRVG